MIFLLDHLNTSSWDSRLDGVATLDGEKLVVSTVEYGDVAIQSIPDGIQISINFAGSPTDDVV